MPFLSFPILATRRILLAIRSQGVVRRVTSSGSDGRFACPIGRLVVLCPLDRSLRPVASSVRAEQWRCSLEPEVEAGRQIPRDPECPLAACSIEFRATPASRHDNACEVWLSSCIIPAHEMIRLASRQRQRATLRPAHRAWCHEAHQDAESTSIASFQHHQCRHRCAASRTH